MHAGLIDAERQGPQPGVPRRFHPDERCAGLPDPELLPGQTCAADKPLFPATQLLKRHPNAQTPECPVPVHPQFGAQHPGRSRAQRPSGGRFRVTLQAAVRVPTSSPTFGSAGVAALKPVWIQKGLSSKGWEVFEPVRLCDGPDHHRVRQRCGRGLPDLARPPGHCPLGLCRPVRGRCPDTVKLDAFARPCRRCASACSCSMQLPPEKLEAAVLQATARGLHAEASHG